jgi:hypothetical protein
MLVAVLVVAGSIAFSSTAEAYTITGCRWSSSTVTWEMHIVSTSLQNEAKAAAKNWADTTDVDGMGIANMNDCAVCMYNTYYVYSPTTDDITGMNSGY